LRYKFTETLSQTFDIGDFIEPDILSVVDASVRNLSDDILAHANLATDLEKTFKVKAHLFSIRDEILEGSVPPSNPDEFMPYELPGVPVIPDFDKYEYEHEPDAEAPAIEPDVPETETEALEIETEVHLDLEEEIPFAAEPVEDEIMFDLPELPPKNEGMEKVRRDMLKFDGARRDRIQTIIVISIIALLNFILFLYLISQ